MRKLCIILPAILACTLSAEASVSLQECRDKARESYPLVRRYDLIHATKEYNVHKSEASLLKSIHQIELLQAIYRQKNGNE